VASAFGQAFAYLIEPAVAWLVPFFFGCLLGFTVSFVSAYYHTQRGSRRTASAYFRFLKYRPPLAGPKDDKLVAVMPKDPIATLATPITVVMVVPVFLMPIMVGTIFIVIPLMMFVIVMIVRACHERSSDDR
jgi:hypothetical protein